MKKYENFCRSLANLKIGLELNEPYTIVEQTGIAGLFEICFEQSWKLLKFFLEDQGASDVKIGSPRNILKIAYSWGVIENEELWLEILGARNVLAHTYSQEQALKVIRTLKKDYITAFEKLKETMDIYFKEAQTVEDTQAKIMNKL